MLRRNVLPRCIAAAAAAVAEPVDTPSLTIAFNGHHAHHKQPIIVESDAFDAAAASNAARESFAQLHSDFSADVDEYLTAQRTAVLRLATILTSAASGGSGTKTKTMSPNRQAVLASAARLVEKTGCDDINRIMTIMPPLAVLRGEQFEKQSEMQQPPLLRRIVDARTGGLHLLGGEFVIDAPTNTFLTAAARDAGYATPVWAFTPLGSGSAEERRLLVPRSVHEEQVVGPRCVPFHVRVLHHAASGRTTQNRNNFGSGGSSATTGHGGWSERRHRIGCTSFPVVFHEQQMVPTLTAAVGLRAVAGARAKYSDTTARLRTWADEWRQLADYFAAGEHGGDDAAVAAPTKHYLRSLAKHGLPASSAQHHVLSRLGGAVGARHAIFVRGDGTDDEADASTSTVRVLKAKGVPLGEPISVSAAASASVQRVAVPLEVKWELELKEVDRSNQPRVEKPKSQSHSPSASSSGLTITADIGRHCCWELAVSPEKPARVMTDRGIVDAGGPYDWQPISLESLVPLWSLSVDADVHAASATATATGTGTATDISSNSCWIRRVRIAAYTLDHDAVARTIVAGAKDAFKAESQDRAFNMASFAWGRKTKPKDASGEVVENHRRDPSHLHSVYKHKSAVTGQPIAVIIAQHLERAVTERQKKVEGDGTEQPQPQPQPQPQQRSQDETPSEQLRSWEARTWWPATALTPRGKKLRPGSEVVRFMMKKRDQDSVLLSFYNDVDVIDASE